MKLCMGCMNQIEEHITTCPYCGFNEKTNRQESYYLKPGTIVGGKYIVGKVMNYSGYTISYIGMDAESERKVVIREYLPSDFATRSEGETDITIYAGDAVQQFEYGLTTFLNDANTMQKLGMLEGIAQVYDCISENDTGYVVSEYVEGRTLKDILQKDKKIALDKAKRIIEKLLSGLCKLHANGIVHCDISPEAIIITDNGNVKLTDFGAAKYVTTANSKSLAIILKQGYAPEEQYRSKGIRGPWTDVYAVAAVMYRMITGIVPPESVDRALMDNLKEPSKLGIEISESMENAIMNALNIYKENRTASAEIFLKELNSDRVQRIKVKKNKNTTGKIPLWCKIMVACFAVIIAVGGVILFNANSKENEDLASENVLKDIKGMTVEEARKIYNEMGIECEDGGWEFNINYDSAISSYCVKDNNTEEDVDVDIGDKIEKNYKIVYKTGRKDKVHYSDLYDDKSEVLRISDINDKLDLDIKKVKEDPDPKTEGFNWGGIICIYCKDGKEIKAKDITSNSDGTLEIKDIKSICYSTRKFFCDEIKESYVGQNIDNVSIDLHYHIMKNGSPKKDKDSTPVSIKDSGVIDNKYYSIDKKKTTGYIFAQSVDKNYIYNQSEKDWLFRVIDKGLYENENDKKTISELWKWKYDVEKDGETEIKIAVADEMKGNWIITDLTLDYTNKKEEDLGDNIFKKGDIVKITVVSAAPATTKAPATMKAPTTTKPPTQTKAPAKKSDNNRLQGNEEF